MNSIRVNIIVQRSNADPYQLSTNIPIKEAWLLLGEVKKYCLAVANIPNSSISELTVNDQKDCDDTFRVFPIDQVHLTVIEQSTAFSASSNASATNTRLSLIPTTAITITTVPQQLDPSSSSSMDASSSSNTANTTPFTAFSFLPSDDFANWQYINTNTIRDCYNSCILNKNLKYSSIDLYDYYNDFPQKAVLVLYGSYLSGSNTDDSVPTDEAEYLMLKSLADLIHTAYPMYEVYTAGVNSLLRTMHEWLGFPVFRTWAESSSRGRLQKMITKRRLYLQEKNTAKSGRYTFTSDDAKQIDELAVSLRHGNTDESIENQIKNTVHLRRAWLIHLHSDDELERGSATVFFEKFPIFMARVELLRHDYETAMQELFGTVPNLEDTFKKYAPTFIYTARINSINLLDDENDICFKALHALPSLVKMFFKNGKQRSIAQLYTESPNLNLNSALQLRSAVTTCPSIVATNAGSRKTYFIAVDDFALHTASTDISHALQRLFEVYYVLDLAYDIYMKDLFELLEYLMDMKTKPAAPVARLGKTIKGFFENPPDNFTAVIASSTVALADESYVQDDDPFAGNSLSQISVPEAAVLNTSQPTDDEEISSSDSQNTEEQILPQQTESNPDASISSSNDFVIPHSTPRTTKQVRRTDPPSPTASSAAIHAPSNDFVSGQSTSTSSTSQQNTVSSQHQSTVLSSPNVNFAPVVSPAMPSRSRGSIEPVAKRSRGRPRLTKANVLP